MNVKELTNTTENLLIEDLQSSGISYRAYMPIHRENVSSLKTDDRGRKYRTVEGAIIVDRRAVQKQMGWTDEETSDHYTTLWDVNGLLTDVRKATYDFRHNRISTGAVGERSWVVDDYEIEIDDKVLKVPARMLAVRVYEDNRIRLRGRNGETIDDGSLLENIENGRVFTWSVEFKPVMQGTTRSGLTVFRSYHTPRISFLDETQGIPDVGGFLLRNYLETTPNNNPKPMTYKKGDQMSRQATIASEAIEKDGQILYSVATNDGTEVEMEQGEIEAVYGKPVEVAETETTPQSDPVQSAEPTSEVRAWVNNAVRNEAGEYGVIVSKVTIQNSDQGTTDTYSVLKASGETVFTQHISYAGGMEGNQQAEWSVVEPSVLFFELLKQINALKNSMMASAMPTREVPKTNTEEQIQSEAQPDPTPTAEEEDNAQAQKLQESTLLTSLIRKSPHILNLIEDGEEKEKYQRAAFGVKRPQSNPSDVPAAQFSEVTDDERAKLLRKWSTKK